MVTSKPIKRFWTLINLEKKEISAIYFYAILSGLIQLSVPIGVQAIISFVLGASMVTSIVLLIFLIVLGVLTVGILQINQMKIIEKIQQRIFVQYAFKFAEKIPRFDLKKMDQVYLPELVNRFFDTTTLQKGMSKILLDIPIAFIQILFGLILLSFYHPIFIAFGLILVILLWLILYISSYKGLHTSMKESSYKYEVAGWLEEMARVISSFKFSQGTNLNLIKTDEKVSGYVTSRTAHFKILLLQYKTLVAFKVIITAAMLIVGSYLLVNQQINIGQFIAAEIVILTVINSVEKLIGNIDSIYDVVTSLEKIETVTEKEIEKDGLVIINKLTTGISVEFQQVNFEYIQGEKILSNISFVIPSNAKVAVIGASRSGKSTLLKLLSRTYNDYEGNILLNGVSITNFSLKNLRDNIGVLQNKNDIFLGSVFENITMGKTEITHEQIINLINELGFSNFLNSLPNGIFTEVLPTGHQFSESVIHKILLLRAFVKTPSLLLLGKPFQSLNSELIKKLQHYILTQTPLTTAFIATNDYSFAQKCDYVIEFKNGILVNIKKN